MASPSTFAKRDLRQFQLDTSSEEDEVHIASPAPARDERAHVSPAGVLSPQQMTPDASVGISSLIKQPQSTRIAGSSTVRRSAARKFIDPSLLCSSSEDDEAGGSTYKSTRQGTARRIKNAETISTTEQRSDAAGGGPEMRSAAAQQRVHDIIERELLLSDDDSNSGHEEKVLEKGSHPQSAVLSEQVQSDAFARMDGDETSKSLAKNNISNTVGPQSVATSDISNEAAAPTSGQEEGGRDPVLLPQQAGLPIHESGVAGVGSTLKGNSVLESPTTEVSHSHELLSSVPAIANPRTLTPAGDPLRGAKRVKSSPRVVLPPGKASASNPTKKDKKSSLRSAASSPAPRTSSSIPVPHARRDQTTAVPLERVRKASRPSRASPKRAVEVRKEAVAVDNQRNTFSSASPTGLSQEATSPHSPNTSSKPTLRRSLYEISQIQRQRHDAWVDQQKALRDKHEDRECTFEPALCDRSRQLAETRVGGMLVRLSPSRRQNLSTTTIAVSETNKRKQIEEDEEAKNCTFSPQINKASLDLIKNNQHLAAQSSLPVADRLHEDFIRRERTLYALARIAMFENAPQAPILSSKKVDDLVERMTQAPELSDTTRRKRIKDERNSTLEEGAITRRLSSAAMRASADRLSRRPAALPEEERLAKLGVREAPQVGAVSRIVRSMAAEECLQKWFGFIFEAKAGGDHTGKRVTFARLDSSTGTFAWDSEAAERETAPPSSPTSEADASEASTQRREQDTAERGLTEEPCGLREHIVAALLSPRDWKANSPTDLETAKRVVGALAGVAPSSIAPSDLTSMPLMTFNKFASRLIRFERLYGPQPFTRTSPSVGEILMSCPPPPKTAIRSSSKQFNAKSVPWPAGLERGRKDRAASLPPPSTIGYTSPPNNSTLHSGLSTRVKQSESSTGRLNGSITTRQLAAREEEEVVRAVPPPADFSAPSFERVKPALDQTLHRNAELEKICSDLEALLNETTRESATPMAQERSRSQCEPINTEVEAVCDVFVSPLSTLSSSPLHGSSERARGGQGTTRLKERHPSRPFTELLHTVANTDICAPEGTGGSVGARHEGHLYDNVAINPALPAELFPIDPIRTLWSSTAGVGHDQTDGYAVGKNTPISLRKGKEEEEDGYLPSHHQGMSPSQMIDPPRTTYNVVTREEWTSRKLSYDHPPPLPFPSVVMGHTVSKGADACEGGKSLLSLPTQKDVSLLLMCARLNTGKTATREKKDALRQLGLKFAKEQLFI